MLRKIATLSIFVLGFSAPLALIGCQSTGSEPYGVQGRAPSESERFHYTDDKNHFHGDLWEAGARPLR